jgi:hypothetical protein
VFSPPSPTSPPSLVSFHQSLGAGCRTRGKPPLENRSTGFFCERSEKETSDLARVVIWFNAGSPQNDERVLNAMEMSDYTSVLSGSCPSGGEERGRDAEGGWVLSDLVRSRKERAVSRFLFFFWFSSKPGARPCCLVLVITLVGFGSTPWDMEWSLSGYL